MSKRFPTPKKWTPTNPQKYEGNSNNIITRSSWETRMLNWLDTNPNIISYSSEEFFIPYISLLEGKPRRYFPDMKAKIKTGNGIKTFIIEIKPANQRVPPTTKNQRRYLQEMETYILNKSKWEAADKWCKERGYEFMILDEYDLGIAKRKG